MNIYQLCPAFRWAGLLGVHDLVSTKHLTMGNDFNQLIK